MTGTKTDAQLTADVRGLFPTPVAVARLPDAERLNAELKRVILEREQGDPGTRHSNLGGWQSSWDLAEWGGPAVRRVLAAAGGPATKLTANRQGGPAAIEWKINCWANVNRRGHGNEFHTHPGAFWSGTYYVEDGGTADDPPAGGEFEIQVPRGLAPAMCAPMLTFAGPGGTSPGASETILPASGMMILFPSWLQHAVRPYEGAAERISIAFNLGIP